MKSKRYWVTLVVLALVAVQVVCGTPLDEYVKAPDSNYGYKVANTIEGEGYTAYVLDMTSQSWRSKKEVDRPLWQHWLTVIKPDKAAGDTAVLWINGGSNRDSAPTKPDQMLAGIALATNTVVADLRMVPNQPLNFPDGGRPRYEDAIIAYTCDKYLATGDETWPLLLPMVKSAVRAMDTVQEHLKSLDEGKLEVKQFVVAGASKRGWTTWLTAAVDKRVIAIVPVVIDVLNMAESMKHHFAAYGFYSPVIHDYVEMKIFDRFVTEEGETLRKFIDPYEYRDRYTMPKFMVNGAGDQFFLPDSAQFYFHDLPGEKYLRYVPNADHGLGGSDADKSFLAFYQSILTGSPRPKFTWRVKDGRIVVRHISGELKEVNLWQATNEKARDFRLEKIGQAWKSSTLEPNKAGRYVGKVATPENGWTAFFVEMVYDSGTPIPFKFTTEVQVVPERLPFAEKASSDIGSQECWEQQELLAAAR
jgi:PhoPQ-activated pathogenicity-related protein